MKKFWWLIFIPTIGLAQVGKNVQEYPIRDFSGGLVNSLSNPLMKDNQAVIFDNFNVTPVGAIQRRRGTSKVYVDAYSGRPIRGILPYGQAKAKQFLLIRSVTGGFTDTVENYIQHDSYSTRTPNTTLPNLIDALTKCDPRTGLCTTIVARDVYLERDRPLVSNWFNQSQVNGDLLFTGNKSEALYYNGLIAPPARPLAPGQPEVVVMDSMGSVNGTYVYSYVFKQTKFRPDTSTAAPESWPVTVVNGKVVIRTACPYYGNPGTKPYVDSVWVLRREPNDSLSKWAIVARGKGNLYIDTSAAITDSLPRDVGERMDAWIEKDSFAIASGNYLAAGPAGMIPVVGGTADTIPVKYPLCIDSGKGINMVGYRMFYTDSAGRSSKLSAWTYAYIDTIPAPRYVKLDSIPVPPSWAGIKSKTIVRYNLPNDTLTASKCPSNPAIPDTGWIIGTLDPSETHFRDTVSLSVYQPDDSLIAFQPADAVWHGFRVWAIGDPLEKGNLYYSDYGRPTCWPYDKFTNVPTRQGDWFTRLVSQPGRLLAFRQNSIVEVTGLSFYQFVIQEISPNVGLSAPRSVGIGQEGSVTGQVSSIRRLLQ